MKNIINRVTYVNNFPNHTNCNDGVIGVIFCWKYVKSPEVWNLHHPNWDYI